MNKDNNNEGERTAQEYVDTTLRSSHYNQTQRIEDATDGNTRKLSTIHKVVLSSVFCIVATWLCTGYVIYKHGSVLFNGDSIEGLREQIESAETSASMRFKHNRKQAAAFRSSRDDVETGLRDQVEKLNVELEKEQKQKRIMRVELNKEKNYRIRIEQQIAGLNRQLGTLVNILQSNDDEEVATKKNLDNSALRTSN
jgi:hypothetical protein